jgi:hypothetical protein
VDIEKMEEALKQLEENIYANGFGNELRVVFGRGFPEGDDVENRTGAIVQSMGCYKTLRELALAKREEIFGNVKFKDSEPFLKKGISAEAGDFVSVRPCDERFEKEYGKQTFLGIYIGDLKIGMNARVVDGNKLEIERCHSNPCIFIPEAGECVLGCGSWWGKITDPEKIREITDETINNVWYVKALKAQIAAHTGECPDCGEKDGGHAEGCDMANVGVDDTPPETPDEAA